MKDENRYFERSLTPVLRRAAAEFPAIILTGPRQSGKTTLLKQVFSQTHAYVSLELPDIRMAATEDPRGFLNHFAPPVIFDEAQYCPGLFPYIKERIDERRSEPGQYILTGSQNLLLMEKITESLAGRAAMLRLLPLSRAEMAGHADAQLPWDVHGSDRMAPVNHGSNLWAEFLRGSFPELAVDPDRDIHLWHASYLQTYLERDVRTLRQVGDLSQFQVFLRALAARNAQMLILTDLARDLGVAVNTVKAWLSVLEASYQVFVLRPYHVNMGKRLVKTPKVYFSDLGTLCYLTGLKDADHAASGPMAGAIMETAVLTEIWKRYTHRGLEARLWFWRTSAGMEVDIIVEAENGLVPLEVKTAATPRAAFATSIRQFRKDLGERVHPGYVVHPGDARLPLGDGVTALPFTAL